jgi:hypothetical protein
MGHPPARPKWKPMSPPLLWTGRFVKNERNCDLSRVAISISILMPRTRGKGSSSLDRLSMLPRLRHDDWVIRSSSTRS